MDADMMRHTIFKTRWGYFGLVCRDGFVCRTILPTPRREATQEALLADIGPDEVPFERDLLSDLQGRISAYFAGENVDFSTDPAVDLAHFSPFSQAILAACRQIGFGRRRTYTQLAAAVGRPQAARAVGNVMAQNPIPLIVPCHRVVRTDGGLGGFSALGGTAVKQRMLVLERSLQPTFSFAGIGA
jgi:O-6-methylguanine DNA methyltransferase